MISTNTHIRIKTGNIAANIIGIMISDNINPSNEKIIFNATDDIEKTSFKIM